MAIIAGYAGVGKTYFAKNSENTVEIPSMPYAWVLPYKTDFSEQESEESKGAYYQHIENPAFPWNMILDVLKAEQQYDNVLIPTIASALEILREKYRKECILVYPKDGLQEEYRQRYIARGNNETFINLFVDDMHDRLNWIKKLSGKHIVLTAGQFLHDVVDEITSYNQNADHTRISEELFDELERKVEQRKKDLALILLGSDCEYIYRVANLEQEKDFIYKVGMLAYQKNLHKPVLFPVEVHGLDHAVVVSTQEEFVKIMCEEGELK